VTRAPAEPWSASAAFALVCHAQRSANDAHGSRAYDRSKYREFNRMVDEAFAARDLGDVRYACQVWRAAIDHRCSDVARQAVREICRRLA
jgi:hypothetical protein